MSTDGSMNLSNITTNFNLGSNSPFYDILSTIVTDSSNNNKITLISSDPSGVFYGNLGAQVGFHHLYLGCSVFAYFKQMTIWVSEKASCFMAVCNQ